MATEPRRSIIDDILAAKALAVRQTGRAPDFIELDPHEVDMLADESRLVPLYDQVTHLQKAVMPIPDWRNVVMAQAMRGELFVAGIKVSVRVDAQQDQAVA